MRMNKEKNVVVGILLFIIINTVTVFTYSEKIINYIIDFIPSDIQVTAMSPVEVLGMSVSISLLISFIIAMPVVVYYIFSFVKDALYLYEIKILKIILFIGTLLFFFGAIFAFVVFTQRGLLWLSNFNVEYGIATIWSLSSTIYSILALSFSAGLVFEIPLVLFLLIKYGLINFKMNSNNRGGLLVGLLILFAIVTPDGTMVTQLALTVPIYLLIEIASYTGNKFKTKEVNK